MNEMLDSQLSAMFDDELSPAECELLARRLAKDEALQDRWKQYALIGAAVRGERGVALSINLRDRVRQVVEADATAPGVAIELPSSGPTLARRAWQGVAGAGLAAGVAALSVMWLRSHEPEAATAMLAQTAEQQPAAIEAGGVDRYVVPVTVESTAMAPTAELANYVVAHSEYSGPLNRRNLLSALVASESGTSQAPPDSEGEAKTEVSNVKESQ